MVKFNAKKLIKNVKNIHARRIIANKDCKRPNKDLYLKYYPWKSIPIKETDCILPLCYGNVKFGEGVTTPLNLVELEIETLINATLPGVSETTVTMTFFNSHDKTLEGALKYTLPDDAVIIGYALEIDDVLVDASIVEKKKAQQVFDTEVRDHGKNVAIAEKVKGNIFNNKIYPMHAKKSKTVQLTYQQKGVVDKQTGNYVHKVQIPFQTKLKKLKVSVLSPKEGVANAPIVDVTNNFTTKGKELEVKMNSNDDDEFYDSSFEAQDVVPTKANEYTITVPQQKDSTYLAIEKDEITGDSYFALDYAPFLYESNKGNETKVDEKKNDVKKDLKVNVFWDSSFSRRDTQNDELSIFNELFVDKLSSSNVTVDFYTVRNDCEKVGTFDFTSKNAEDEYKKFETFVKDVYYDGATNFEVIPFDVDGEGKDAFNVFVTDGIATIGLEKMPVMAKPVMVINLNSGSNATLLKYIGEKSGGVYISDAEGGADQIYSAFYTPPYQLIKAKTDNNVKEVYPSSEKTISTVNKNSSRITVVGILKKGESEIVLKYGANHVVDMTHTFKISEKDAVPEEYATGIVKRVWAQQKIDELSVFPDKNKSTLLKLGQEHNIVTDGASLIVLETLQQHLKHKIAPSKLREGIYESYAKSVNTETNSKDTKIVSKLSKVSRWWNDMVSWHKKDFETKPKPKPTLKNRGGMFGGGGGPPLASSSSLQRRAMAPMARSAPRSESKMMEELERPRMAKKKKSKSKRSAGPSLSLNKFKAKPAKKAKDQVKRKKKKDSPSPARSSAKASISVKKWNPNTPYNTEIKNSIKNVKPELQEKAAYESYKQQRKEYILTPSFYFDVSTLFFNNGWMKSGLRILTNVVELSIEEPQLYRICGYKLSELGQHTLGVSVFEKVQKMKPDQPQSHRDLALEYVHLAKNEEGNDYLQRGIDLLWKVVCGKWDARYSEIEVTALVELNNAFYYDVERLGYGKDEITLPKLNTQGKDHQVKEEKFRTEFTKRHIKAELRISMAWDTDMVDIDLHTLQPDGVNVYYGNKFSSTGSRNSRDFTRGFGPEEFMCKKSMEGIYKVSAKYFSNSQQSLTGGTTILLHIFKFYGEVGKQDHQVISLRLSTNQSKIEVAQVDFKH